MKAHPTISEALESIFSGIKRLAADFPDRKFTIDGRLVGDIGEVIAALHYDIILDKVARPKHDACCSDGRNVQIKATFKDSLTFGSVPDYYLGLKLYTNGDSEEIFNGPGDLIFKHYPKLKGIGVKLLSFPIKQLQQLSQPVPDRERIPKRGAAPPSNRV